MLQASKSTGHILLIAIYREKREREGERPLREFVSRVVYGSSEPPPPQRNRQYTIHRSEREKNWNLRQTFDEDINA